LLKLDELFREIKTFLILSCFSIIAHFVFKAKSCFKIFLVDIFPLESGTVVPSKTSNLDPDPGSENNVDPELGFSLWVQKG